MPKTPVRTSEVAAVDRGASLQEKSGRVGDAEGRAGVERCAARAVARVDAGALLDQEEHEVEPVGDTRPVQGCEAESCIRDVDHAVQGVLL